MNDPITADLVIGLVVGLAAGMLLMWRVK